MDPTELSVVELLAAYHDRSLSPTEVLDAYSSRIDKLEPSLQAFATLSIHDCQPAATVAEERWLKGTARPLEGIPIGVKDLISVRGSPTTGGSDLYSDHISRDDAEVIRRLREAGCLPVGKLRTTEFGFGPADLPNPWDQTRTAGGSSAGPAIAVAAREVPLSLGTDTGGSVRAPAAFCGVAGLKPTFGRVSNQGVMPMSHSLDHVGVIARRVADTAVALAAMDRKESHNPKALVDGHSRQSLATLRIGIPQEWFLDVCDPEVLTNFETAIEILKLRGATINDVHLPLSGHHDLSALWWFTLAPELTSLHEPHLQPGASKNTNPRFRTRIREGFFVSATDYIRAQRVRCLLLAEFEAAFETVDVILTPGAPCVAPELAKNLLAEIGEDREPLVDILGRVYHPFNLTGHPALCIPSGLNRRGLPTSVQLVSALNRDELCVSVGEAIEDDLDLRISPSAYEATGPEAL